MLKTTLACTLALCGATVLLVGDAESAPRPAAAGLPTVYEVTITNLTRAQVFSPVLVTSHERSASLFELGSPASPELAELAEEGNAMPLADALSGLAAVVDVQVGGGPIPPGTSQTIQIVGTPGSNVLSLAGMLVQTNDAFVALDSVELPMGRRADYDPLAYDAGSEFNSESCDYVPGPPCGAAGAHDPTPAEGYVYVHNGMHGIGDLAEETYDWRGPVARVRVQRMP